MVSSKGNFSLLAIIQYLFSIETLFWIIDIQIFRSRHLVSLQDSRRVPHREGGPEGDKGEATRWKEG